MVALEKKFAKRKVKCRECGKEIPKGGTYYIAYWSEGPYLRRRALCYECAREYAIRFIKWWMSKVFWNSLCRDVTYEGMTVSEALAIQILGLKTRKVYECPNDSETLLVHHALRAWRKRYVEELNLLSEEDFIRIAKEVIESYRKENRNYTIKWR